MACNHSDHNWNCNCDKDGTIVSIEITDDIMTGYNGLIAAIPEDGAILDEFNKYIVQYGGLDKVCEVFPYVDLDLNRYGIFVPKNMNMFSKFSNLYHIMKAMRRHEPNEYIAMQKQQPQQQPQQLPQPTQYAGYESQQQSYNIGYVPATEEECVINPMGSYTEYTGGYRSREDEQFELAVSKVFVSTEDNSDKQQDIGFKVSLDQEGKNDGYMFRSDRIGDLEPEGGLENYNPTWHPNDPKNYPAQTPSMPANIFAPITMPQTNYYSAPGFINGNNPEKESFFSVGKLAQDRGMVAPQMPNLNTASPGWRPNHPILKNAEFPEGVDESHPQFESVRQQMQFDCFGPENEIAKAYTRKADTVISNMIDTGNPELYMPNELSDEEVQQALLEEQFGARQRAYQSANTEVDRYSAMNGLPPFGQQMVTPTPIGANPYFANNPWLQNQQSQMNHMNGMHNMMGGMFPGARHFETNNEWMLPTEDEIKSGKVPVATVVRDGENPESIAPARKRGEDDIKSALVRVHTDENGVEYDEFLCGDREAVREKPNKDSLTYKEAATLAKKTDLELDTYALAKELARYNTTLADNLLWSQSNLDVQEFMDVRREAQQQLIRYRSDDKLSIIKSSVFIAGDKTVVGPPKPTTMEELERIAKEELSGRKTQEDKEEEIVNRYRGANFAINEQRRAILSGGTVKEIITKLQALTDMRVNCGDEEIKMYEKIDQRVKQLPPIKISERDNYLTWKRLSKGAKMYRGEDVSNFDEEFDAWWNKPRNITPEQKREQYEKYQLQMTEMNIDHHNRVAMNAPSPEELEKRYMNNLSRLWNEYDEGYITSDMGLSEHLDNLGFLMTRNIELKIQRESNKASRLFDPNAYLKEVRKHSALRNFQEGKGFVPTTDLMDQRVYQQKRQAFIDQIFKKANRGTLT